MTAPKTPSLTLDEIDDLLYFTRVNEVEDLQQTLAGLSQKYSCSQQDIINAAVDPESGNTVFHYCSANGFVQLLKQILAYFGIESVDAGESEARNLGPSIINTTNKEGNTALHWASVNGQLDVVKLLISVGADMSKTNAAGHSAVFEAERAGKGNVVEYLLERSQPDVNPEDLIDVAGDDHEATNGTHHVNGDEDADMVA